MLLLFSIVYWAFFIVTLVPGFLIGSLIFLLTFLFDRRRYILNMYTAALASFLVAANPLWKVRVVGRDKLPTKGSAIYVANHASLVDILVIFLLFKPFKWVSKVENFRVPIIGWMLRMNDAIPIKRGSRSSVMEMMRLCRSHLSRGSPILFFPEGTRSKTGELQPFKDGAFALAVAVDCPVFPIVISGTAQTLPKHGLVLRNRMEGVVEVLDPLNPEEFGTARDLREGAQRAMSKALAS